MDIKAIEDINEIIYEKTKEASRIVSGPFMHKINEAREASYKYFLQNGMPTRKNEEYKYTPISKLIEKEFDFSTLFDTTETGHSQIKFPFEVGDATVITFVNGVYCPDLSSSDKTEGLLISAGANIDLQETVSKHYNKYLKNEKDAFASLNTSFSTLNNIIEIKEGTDIKRAIIVFDIINAHKPGQAFNCRNLYVVNKNASANIVEYSFSLNDTPYFVNYASELFVDHGAKVNLFKVQNESINSVRADNTQVSQNESLCNVHTYSLSGKMVRNNLGIEMETENCEAHMYGIYATNGNMHVDNHTTADHKMPNCFSNEIYKGILDENSKGVFNGKIYVRQNAQKTNAFQSNKNIVLSNDASINTKPQLEIWADDVKCSHGCTVGQINEEQLFYLKARGLSDRSAKALLLHAFANDVLEQIGIPELRDHLDAIISSKLHI